MSVKEAVLPFARFRTAEGQNVDALLGPEMKSTGEVMGIDVDFGRAFAKSQLAAYGGLPDSGTVFVSVANRDKRAMLFPVRGLVDLGFTILATSGTADVLRRNGIPAQVVRKITQRGEQPLTDDAPEDGPTIAERIIAGEVDMVVNTPTGSGARSDGWEIRRAAIKRGVPCLTTLSGGLAATLETLSTFQHVKAWEREFAPVHEEAVWHLYRLLWELSCEAQPDLPFARRRALIDGLLAAIRGD